MKAERSIQYSVLRDDEHLIDLCIPDGECKALLVYLHGGGFVEGSRELDALPHFAEDMTEAGIAVASVEYRMYPRAKYPDFIEDAAEAVAYAKDTLLPRLGCDRLFVAGTSAGGYLSQMLCFDEVWLGRRGVARDDIAGYIHDAGQPTAHFNVLKERGIDPRRIIVDGTAPLYHVKRGDYPPMQIIVSDRDIPGRYEQTELLVGALRAFGYDEERLTYTKTSGSHVWYVTKTDENGKNEFASLIIPFIQKHI